MTVTLFGASGQVGRQLVQQCLARGWNVKAFGRNVEWLIDEDLRSEKLVAIRGYVLDGSDVRQALEGSDAVLSALGGGFDGTDKTRSLGMKQIVAQMQKAGIRRIVALGGLGVLPDGKGGFLMDSPDYPPEYVPVGQEHRAAYECLKASGLDWTFFCSVDITPGDADRHYVTAVEAPAGGNQVSAGNLADAMAEAIARGTFIRQRIGISNSSAE